MSYSGEGNRRSDVTLAMYHRLLLFILILRAQSLMQGEKHPAYAALGHGTIFYYP